MTSYTCLECNAGFSGHDPLDFTDIEIKNKVLPFCPWSKNGLMGPEEFYNLEIDLEKFKQGAAAAKATIKNHRVVEGNHVVFKPKGKLGHPVESHGAAG